jgi:signal transduction histidine kinase
VNAEPHTDVRIFRGLVFLLSALVLGAVDFALLLTGWIVVPLLAVTPASAGALLGFRWSVRQVARLEAWLARKLLGSRVTLPPAARGAGYWGSGRAALGDRSFWQQQVYLAYRATGGWALGLGWGILLAVGGYLTAMPAYYQHVDNTFGGAWKIDTLQEAFAVVPAGLVVLAVCLWATPLTGRMSRALAEGLLGAPARGRRRNVTRHRALLAHAGLYATVNAVLILIWALTGAGYFWPEWTLLPLAVPLAIHAWIELLASRPDIWRRRGMTEAFAIHAGTAAILSLFLFGVWAVTGAGYPWPLWSMLGLALPVVVHALVVLRGGRERIERLEQTRAGAVDAQETELRRIERDLHDGAQARLVALGMSLGLAEQRLADDPEAARELVAEARAGLGEALRELRDLARGIHPPILTDRGLPAAVAALADRSPIPIDVETDVPDRPAPTVETAAYFVVAEALANAAKHADASAVRVRIDGRGDVLSIRVEDDGRGGADAAGHGLHGLRRRVEALDGTFTVASPAGGPTIVEAELPCAS